MPRMIFVNLPVHDVGLSTAFYEAIGFTRDPAFSNDQSSAMVWSDTITFMLLSHAFYATFTAKEIADAKRTAQVSLCLSMDSRAAVDAIARAAVAAGGEETRPPMDHGNMFGRTFEDPDGHIVEPMWMDRDAFLAAQSGAA